jgi:hypothetical protein
LEFGHALREQDRHERLRVLACLRNQSGSYSNSPRFDYKKKHCSSRIQTERIQAMPKNAGQKDEIIYAYILASDRIPLMLDMKIDFWH